MTPSGARRAGFFVAEGGGGMPARDRRAAQNHQVAVVVS
jgi:hypothetical protein